jgi:anaerobic magnesium-protoporphyrin IX monomethyl ester cyclase
MALFGLPKRNPKRMNKTMVNNSYPQKTDKFRIMLINPPFTGFGSGLSGHGGKAAPLNLGYLASYCLKVDPELEIAILDGENLGIGFEGVEGELHAYKPDLVGMTFPTPAYVHVERCAKIVKDYGDIPVVVGGPHPSAFPEGVIRELADIDICVIGEGERAFADLVQCIKNGGSLESLKGICFRKGNEPVRNEGYPLLMELDELPFPARDLLPVHLYYSPSTKRVSDRLCGNMITSRGCPYDCTYCESKVIWTRRVRLRSVDNVCDEIEECITKYGIGEINFHDDILPMRRERTIDLCREIQRRKLDVKWICMSRVNFVWEDAMEEMKKSGCKRIMFGLESGSNTILKNIKKNTTIERAFEAVEICKKVGIETMGSFMIGNIGETEDTIKETIQFAKDLKLDIASFFVTIPYPGTELFSEAVKLGYMDREVNWEDFKTVGKSLGPLNLPGLSAERMQYWQARALREFYLRPSMIYKRLSSVRSFEEVKSLARGVKLLVDISKNLLTRKTVPS